MVTADASNCQKETASQIVVGDERLGQVVALEWMRMK